MHYSLKILQKLTNANVKEGDKNLPAYAPNVFLYVFWAKTHHLSKFRGKSIQ